MKIHYLPKTRKFIDSLEEDLHIATVTLIDMLEEGGHLLGLPYSKSLGKGLFELRLLHMVHIRIFYCFHQNTAYLLHGILKKSQKIPRKEIEFARKMKKFVESI